MVAGIALLILIVALSQLSGSDHPDQPPTAHVRSGEPQPETTAQRQTELIEFVATNCPGCHGERLGGSIGPPLSKATLEHLSGSALASTILHGRVEKGMPPWQGQLSPQDAHWIAEFLKRDGVADGLAPPRSSRPPG